MIIRKSFCFIRHDLSNQGVDERTSSSLGCWAGTAVTGAMVTEALLRGAGEEKDHMSAVRTTGVASTVLARFALFVNGIARGAILPYGPTLIYRLVNGPSKVTSSTWSSISFQLAMVFISFTVGQSLGILMAKKLPYYKLNVHHYVARLGGATMALHLFSCGVAISSVFWLVAIRFISAVNIGIMCSITDPNSLPEEPTKTTNNFNSPGNEKSSKARPAIGSGAAMVFLTGFAISILSGGIAHRSLSAEDVIPGPMTEGSLSLKASLLLLVATGIVFEMALRRAFALTTQPDHLDHGYSSGPAEKVTKFVRSIVEGKHHHQQRVSFKENSEFLLMGSPVSNSNVSSLRPRTASYNSAATEGSDYFDCQSDLSDVDMEQNDLRPFLEGDDVAQYVDKKCCYADGSPAFVTPGDAASVVPRNYLENCRGNQRKAMKMWQETQKWRRDRQVWKIHTMPNKFFKQIKRDYPHNVGGHSKKGLPCIYEQPGKMDIKSLFRDSGCTVDDMVHHYIFCTEYFCNCLCASKELRRVAGKEREPYSMGEFGIVVIMDIKGTGLQFLNGDIMVYLKKVSDINAVHYPLSITRVLVVNCPFWAGVAASTLKKVLPESVKLDLFTSDCIDGLRQYIDDDQIRE
jgi:CRAL/TRIO domain